LNNFDLNRFEQFEIVANKFLGNFRRKESSLIRVALSKIKSTHEDEKNKKQYKYRYPLLKKTKMKQQFMLVLCVIALQDKIDEGMNGFRK
jgi:hypothetical protein